jgi:thioredoxin 1
MSVSATVRTFDTEVLTGEQPVLVDFWAPWCAPCRAVAPVVERLAQEHDLKLVKVNYDEEPEIAERYGIMAIPNIVLFRNGKPAAQALGARPQQALEIALGLSR